MFAKHKHGGSARDILLNSALQQLADIADAQGKQHRANAYQRVIALGEEVAGDDIAEKIAEFHATGHIKELDQLMARADIRALVEFNTILGIGEATAHKLVAQGYHNRAQLMEAMHARKWIPTHVQMLGLIHYDDLRKPIARETVAMISDIIIAIARETIHALDVSASIRATIAGSYRRGAQTCGDIDILLEVPINSQKQFAHNFAQLIAKHNSFVSIIVVGTQKISFLWKYAWVLSIDIIIANPSEYYASLVYFTGSRNFNIWLRELCSKYDYSLNQYGLRDKLREDRIIELRNERHIFDILGIEWIPPSGRN